MDKMEPNIVNVTKTNNLLHDRITAQEQDKVVFHSGSSEHQGADLGEKVRPSPEELRSVKVVRDQTEAMSTCKYTLVAGLFNQNSLVPKTSGHLSSHSPF